jgi:hypothetical protein
VRLRISLLAPREEVIMAWECIVRMRNDYCGNVGEIDFEDVQLLMPQEGTTSRLDLNTSFEEEIEYIWFQSRLRGWSYDDFMAHLLEILAILRLRDKIKLPPSPAKPA